MRDCIYVIHCLHCKIGTCNFDYHGCLHYEDFKDALATFPQKNVLHIKKAQKFGLVERRALQDENNLIAKDLNKKFQKQYRTIVTKQFKKSLSLSSEVEVGKTVMQEIERQMNQT